MPPSVQTKPMQQPDPRVSQATLPEAYAQHGQRHPSPQIAAPRLAAVRAPDSSHRYGKQDRPQQSDVHVEVLDPEYHPQRPLGQQVDAIPIQQQGRFNHTGYNGSRNVAGAQVPPQDINPSIKQNRQQAFPAHPHQPGTPRGLTSHGVRETAQQAMQREWHESRGKLSQQGHPVQAVSSLSLLCMLSLGRQGYLPPTHLLPSLTPSLPIPRHTSFPRLTGPRSAEQDGN